MSFEAYHLPITVSGLEKITAGAGLECHYPTPTAELLEETARRLKSTGERLAERPCREIVEVVDSVAHRFLDPEDSVRQEAESLLLEVTGYSPAMARLVLDRMAADWRAEPLLRLLEAELGSADALDAFIERPGGTRARAYGARLAFHLFAGNVPGVAVTSIVRSLLVKTPVLAKSASVEPVLPVLFARALARADAALGDAVAVTYFPGADADTDPDDDDDPLRLALHYADLAVVYGGEDAVAAVRAAARPELSVRVHGPRFSAGIVMGDALNPPGDETALRGLARRIARAAATFDQHGCVSPHAVWVEDPDRAVALPLARAVADAFARTEATLPRGALSAPEASAFQQARGAAEMKGHDGAPVRLFGGQEDAWAVVYDAEATFRPSCLNRFLTVHPVPSVAEAIDALEPVGRQLQSVALEGGGDRRPAIAHALARAGATRITTLDALPWPPAQWHHDGAGPLQELVTWVDLEG